MILDVKQVAIQISAGALNAEQKMRQNPNACITDKAVSFLSTHDFF